MELDRQGNLGNGDRLAIFERIAPGDYFVEVWHEACRVGEEYAYERVHQIAFHVKVPAPVANSAHMVNWLAYSNALGPAEVRPYSEHGSGRMAFATHEAFYHRSSGVLTIGNPGWIRSMLPLRSEGAVRLVAANGAVAYVLGPDGWRVQSVRL
jgi:hypothetical protein